MRERNLYKWSRYTGVVDFCYMRLVGGLVIWICLLRMSGCLLFALVDLGPRLMIITSIH